MTRDSGRLVVLVGPSGSGKTTLARALIGASPQGRCFSVSHTTRPQRSGERDGVDYHFVDRQRFRAMIDRAEFVEHAEVHGNCYGTSRAAIDAPLSRGLDVLFDVDIQGAAALYAAFGAGCQLIFVIPPSWEELVHRLVGRSSETDETLRRRLRTARAELTRVVSALDAGVPWACLVNDDLDTARETLESMLSSAPQPATAIHVELLRAMLAAANADPLAADLPQ